MVGNVDDELLSRWIDGELKQDEADRVSSLVETDKEVSARVAAIEARDASVRDWFDDQLAPPASELERSVGAAFAARRAQRERSGRQWWLPAAAAIAVLIAGIAGFDYLIDHRVNDALDRMRAERASDIAMLASAMQDVLENRESGVEVSFENAETGLEVALKPKRTWKSRSGHWCREFSEIVGAAQPESTAVSVACRTPDGQWMRVSTEVPGALFPLIPEVSDRRDL